MSKLEDLEKQLYRKGEELEKRTSRGRVIFPQSTSKISGRWKEVGEAPPGPLRKKLLKVFLGVLFIFLFFGSALFVFLYLGKRGDETRISIEGRQEIESGEVVTVPFSIQNLSSSPLKETELIVVFPEGSIIREGSLERLSPPRLVRSLAEFKPRERRLEEVAVRIFGREGEEKKIDATFVYRPENLSARFSSEVSKTVNIRKVPLGISWELPSTLSRGQEFEMLIHYSSSARDKFENLSLQIEYPSGFSFSESSPKPTKDNNIWSLGDLKSGGGGVISVRGKITGEEGEIKAFRGGVGVFNYSTQDWKSYIDSSHEVNIAVAPLVVKSFLSGSRVALITPGEKIQFVVRYENHTPFPLKNVSVRTSLEGSILNMDTLVISQNGVYDFSTRSIIWGPANLVELRELPSGAVGDLTFVVNTKETPPVKSQSDTNLIVRVVSSIEASGIPRELIGTELTHRDEVDFKVNSKVLFSGGALYTYPPLSNTGPTPPKVAQKTTYTIVWEVRDFTNNLKGAEVKSTLPPNVGWESKKLPQTADITFNPASREIRWKIGTVEAGRGVRNPALVGSFQLSVIPSEVDVGKIMTLINPVVFTAEDVFTGNKIELRVDNLTTEVRDDPVVDRNGWIVVR